VWNCETEFLFIISGIAPGTEQPIRHAHGGGISMPHSRLLPWARQYRFIGIEHNLVSSRRGR
jgi:hypothetical protein